MELHINECLDRKTAIDLAKKIEEEDVFKEECPVCHLDITLYNKKRKEQHLEKCKKKEIENQKKDEEMAANICVICKKDMNGLNQKSKISHIKLCAKVQKLKPKEVKEMIEKIKSENKNQPSKPVNNKKEESIEEIKEGISLDDSIFEEYKYEPKTKNSNVQTLPQTVQEWLSQIGLTQYLDIFLNNGFDSLEVCSEITKEDIEKEMDIKLIGHVKKLVIEIKKLKKNLLIQKESSRLQDTIKKPLRSALPSIIKETEPKKKEPEKKKEGKKKKKEDKKKSEKEEKEEETKFVPLLQIEKRRSNTEIARELLSDIESKQSFQIPSTQPFSESVFKKSKSLWSVSTSFDNNFDVNVIKMNEQEDKLEELNVSIQIIEDDEPVTINQNFETQIRDEKETIEEKIEEKEIKKEFEEPLEIEKPVEIEEVVPPIKEEIITPEEKEPEIKSQSEIETQLENSQPIEDDNKVLDSSDSQYSNQEKFETQFKGNSYNTDSQSKSEFEENDTPKSQDDIKEPEIVLDKSDNEKDQDDLLLEKSDNELIQYLEMSDNEIERIERSQKDSQTDKTVKLFEVSDDDIEVRVSPKKDVNDTLILEPSDHEDEIIDLKKDYQSKCNLLVDQFKYKVEELYKTLLEDIDEQTRESKKLLNKNDFFINFIPPDLIDIFQKANNNSILSPNSHKPLTPIPKEKESKISKENHEIQEEEDVLTQSQETVSKPKKKKTTKKKKDESQKSSQSSQSSQREVLKPQSQKSSQQDVQRSSQSNSQKSIPNFEEMSLDDLKKELSKYGVKSGKKKYMVEKLTQIFNEIHK